MTEWVGVCRLDPWAGWGALLLTLDDNEDDDHDCPCFLADEQGRPHDARGWSAGALQLEPADPTQDCHAKECAG